MTITKDYVDARDDALRSHVDAEFSKLRADLKSIPSKGTIWGAVATGVGLLLAVLAIAGDRFDGGFSAAGVFAEQTEQNKQALEQVRTEVSQTKQDIMNAIGALVINQPKDARTGKE